MAKIKIIEPAVRLIIENKTFDIVSSPEVASEYYFYFLSIDAFVAKRSPIQCSFVSTSWSLQ